jgi:hypothetical protein
MEIKKTVWVIMDKKRKVIGSGVPRNRELKLIDDPKGTARILTYASKNKAISGFRDSGFFCWGDAHDYMEENYGEDWQRHNRDIHETLDAVKIELIMREVGDV